jgi:hypothetical protein
MISKNEEMLEVSTMALTNFLSRQLDVSTFDEKNKGEIWNIIWYSYGVSQ